MGPAPRSTPSWKDLQGDCSVLRKLAQELGAQFVELRSHGRILWPRVTADGRVDLASQPVARTKVAIPLIRGEALQLAARQQAPQAGRERVENLQVWPGVGEQPLLVAVEATVRHFRSQGNPEHQLAFDSHPRKY